MASMQIRPDEITKILKERIEGIEEALAEVDFSAFAPEGNASSN